MSETIERPSANAAEPAAARSVGSSLRRPALYIAAALGLTATTLGLVTEANRRYAPEMYRPEYMTTVAEALANGEGYAVFDLNINIRKLREEQWQRLDRKPSLIVLGASQWQEATADLLPGRDWLNGHVHRDYYEDVVGLVGLLSRHDKLPKDLVITIRDRMFTPVMQRTDFLWLPGIPYYQSKAPQLGLPQLTLRETYPLQWPRELISLPMLFTNVTRWHNASDWPYPTAQKQHPTLDILNPDGSITWSQSHLALFTPERARKVALAHADANRPKPPVIDPKGVEAFDRTLAYLNLRGVRVHLAHPPFNPIYFDRIQGTPYLEGLRQVEAVTRELAARHKAGLVGSFDPADLGCTADMFIDAEHSNHRCLRKLLADVARSVDLPMPPPGAQTPSIAARQDARQRQTVMASGWMSAERRPAPAAKAAEPAAATVAAVVGAPSALPASSAPAAAAPPAAPATEAAAPTPPAVLPALQPRAPLAEAVPPARNRQVRRGPATRVATRPASRKAATRRPVNAASAAPRLVWPGDRPTRRQ